MKLTIKPIIHTILTVLFAVFLTLNLHVGNVKAEEKQPTQPITLTEESKSQTSSETTMPTMTTILPTLPTISPKM